MSEKNDKRAETFREYLTRRLLPYKPKAAKGLVPWDENRGGNLPPLRGANQLKAKARVDRKVNRLAHIAYERRNGNERHVPKLKRVPAHVFD